MDENEKQSLKERLRIQESRIYEFQEKLTYYILAIDAACIGFSISITKDSKLSWWLIAIAISILLWVISFYAGIRELEVREENYKAMYRYTDAVIQEASTERAKHFSEISKFSTDTDKFKKRKMCFLCLGIFVFIVWDIANIISHTYK